MGKVYSGQSSLRITLKVSQDLSTVSSALIKFRKPNGQEGSFPGSLDAANESIYYDVQTTDELDRTGTWNFWAELTYNDGRIGIGEPDSYEIFKEGTLKK